jgi:hypothetical protein
MTDKVYAIIIINGTQKHVAPRLAEIFGVLADDEELNRLLSEYMMNWQELKISCKGKSIKPAVTVGR